MSVQSALSVGKAIASAVVDPLQQTFQREELELLGPPVEDKDEDEENDLDLLGRGHKEDQSTSPTIDIVYIPLRRSPDVFLVFELYDAKIGCRM